MKRTSESTLALDADHQETRQRLLEAASDEFAEHGFHQATVRGICRRAKANLAAVGYHFGGKLDLYSAVLVHAHHSMISSSERDAGHERSPERELRTFVHGLLHRLLDQGPNSRHGKLVAREMVDPTPALDAMVEGSIRPQFERLSAIIGQLAGRRVGADTARDCVFSIIGQCLFYHHGRPVHDRLFPDRRLDDDDIATLADHITRFTLAAVRGYRHAAGQRPRAKAHS